MAVTIEMGADFNVKEAIERQERRTDPEGAPLSRYARNRAAEVRTRQGYSPRGLAPLPRPDVRFPQLELASRVRMSLAGFGNARGAADFIMPGSKFNYGNPAGNPAGGDSGPIPTPLPSFDPTPSSSSSVDTQVTQIVSLQTGPAQSRLASSIQSAAGSGPSERVAQDAIAASNEAAALVDQITKGLVDAGWTEKEQADLERTALGAKAAANAAERVAASPEQATQARLAQAKADAAMRTVAAQGSFFARRDVQVGLGILGIGAIFYFSKRHKKG